MTGEFTLAVDQNEYLSVDGAEMHAVLTVAASGLGAVPANGAAEVVVIDCSGSMHYPPTKIAAARRATAAAIDALREGVHFALVEGTHTARVLYPTTQRLAPANARTRAEAKRVAARLVASGGTAIGSWLRLADRLLAEHPTAVRHVVLLTDGKNQTETRQELDAVLADCEGRFVCDARGIGEDWAPEELLRIVSALHGSADAVREDADLVGDFTGMVRTAMGKVVPDLRIRIRTTPFARVRFFRQKFPTDADLTGFGERVDERTTVFSTGSWGEETREFHVCLDVDRAGSPLREDVQAARVDLVGTADHRYGGPGAVRVHWTDDLGLSSVIDPKVAHVTGQAELGKAIMAGCDAYDRGDRVGAKAEWALGVRRAAELGNDEVLTRLGRLVDIVGEPRDGVVRLKENLSLRDVLGAAMSSVFSNLSPSSVVEEPAVAQGPSITCSACDALCPAGDLFCQRCRNPLGDGA